MKIKIISTSLALFCSLLSNSQVGTHTLSEEIPESGSITGASVWNPNFNGSFVYLMSHGLTTFNQKTDLLLIDGKTLKEKKNMEFPKFKGYDGVTIRTHQSLSYYGAQLAELNQNLVLFFKSKRNKLTDISAVKVNESFTVAEKPDYLFSVSDESNIIMSTNDKKDICVFSNEQKNKKSNSATFYYRVFNSELKLLKVDSLVSDLKMSDTLNALAYDNGCILIKTHGLKRSATVFDLKNNKSMKFELPTNNNTANLTLEKIKAITGDKIVLFGSYTSPAPKKKLKNGMFKLVYNMKTNLIEDQQFYELVPQGKNEYENLGKYVHKAIISETGACYALIFQNNQSYTPTYAGKFEIVYLNSNSEKWKKQLPILSGGSFDVEMFLSNKNLFITYLDYEGDNNKINFNNYIYGEPTPSNPVTLRQVYKSNVSLLKINTAGSIQQQTIPNIYYKYITCFNNGFLGINQGLNGQVTSKCKFVKISVNDK